jgi:hypothetical protein
MILLSTPRLQIAMGKSSTIGIVTLIEGGGNGLQRCPSGCRARAIPHIEGVSPKALERGSVE